jgi:hypothetical protein
LTIFIFRRVSAAQNPDRKTPAEVETRNGLPQTQIAGCCFRFGKGNENGGPAPAGIGTVPMFTGLSCQDNLLFIRA